MPTIKRLRIAYWVVFAGAFVSIVFGILYLEQARGLAEAHAGPVCGAYIAASQAFIFTGMLATVTAIALTMFVGHLEALECALEKLVAADAEPDSAKHELCEFLRRVKPSRKGAVAKSMDLRR